MKRLLAGAGALATIAYGCLGFSGDAKAQLMAPPGSVVPGWAGFYLGVNGGAGWGDSSTSVTTTSTFENFAALSAIGQSYGPTAITGANGTVSVGGTKFLGGGQAGFNFPLTPSWMLGVEADIDAQPGASSGTATNVLTRPGFPGNVIDSAIAVTKQINYLATVRGRIGYLFWPEFLVYGTGGLAVGDVDSSTTLTAIEVPNTGSTNVHAFGESSKTIPGYTFGAGAEWLMGRGWSLKAEYLYYSLGTLSYSNTPFGATLFSNGATDFAANSTSRTSFKGNILRVGLNYHF
jgi:outer membrane immunogenic protein